MKKTVLLLLLATSVRARSIVQILRSSSFYVISNPLIMNVSSVTFQGIGSPEIKEITAGTPGIKISSSNITVDGIILTGVQHASANIPEIAIISSAPSSSNQLNNITVKNCIISNWGEQGIFFYYVNSPKALNNHVFNIVYSGIQGRMVNHADFSNNEIDNLGPGDGGVLVAISITGNTTQAEVPIWELFQTIESMIYFIDMDKEF